mmetsp:Transcript_27453/g.80439  ORF Transcript_27453/g.80439 Transcript_27453/m.80439 type:complete len:234 (+) Transcript_27453:1275-1976(+)
MRALLWWGADDHAWAPKVPLYGGATAVDRTYDDANCSARLACREANGLPGSMLSFSWDSAFWVNSAVARLVYQDVSRAAPVVRGARCEFEEWAAPEVTKVEALAATRFAAGDADGGVAALTALAVAASKEATARWTALWGKLMVTFQDGATAAADATNKLCGCSKETPTYSDDWLAKLVADTGDHYRLPDGSCEYLDPDGHCHHKPPSPVIGAVRKVGGAGPIPKIFVPGVVG